MRHYLHYYTDDFPYRGREKKKKKKRFDATTHPSFRLELPTPLLTLPPHNVA